MERIDKLNQMLQQHPTDCFLMHALGLEYLKINDSPTDLKYFEKVIATDNQYIGTYYHLAKTYEKMQETAKAISIYEKGIEIAQKLKDNHAKNELQMALDEIIDD